MFNFVSVSFETFPLFQVLSNTSRRQITISFKKFLTTGARGMAQQL